MRHGAPTPARRAAPALAATRRPGIRDHGSDVLAYVCRVPIGTVLGAVVGAWWPDPAPP